MADFRDRFRSPHEPAGDSHEPAGDRGSISVFVVIFSVAVFLLAGLLVDGGSMINARLRAADVAEQAARAAADTIDEEEFRSTGRVRISDAGLACAKADDIIAAHDESGASATLCDVVDDQVTVGVAMEWKVFFLGVIGLEGMEVKAQATAVPRTGGDEP